MSIAMLCIFQVTKRVCVHNQKNQRVSGHLQRYGVKIIQEGLLERLVQANASLVTEIVPHSVGGAVLQDVHKPRGKEGFRRKVEIKCDKSGGRRV